MSDLSLRVILFARQATAGLGDGGWAHSEIDGYWHRFTLQAKARPTAARPRVCRACWRTLGGDEPAIIISAHGLRCWIHQAECQARPA